MTSLRGRRERIWTDWLSLKLLRAGAQEGATDCELLGFSIFSLKQGAIRSCRQFSTPIMRLRELEGLTCSPLSSVCCYRHSRSSSARIGVGRRNHDSGLLVSRLARAEPPVAAHVWHTRACGTPDQRPLVGARLMRQTCTPKMDRYHLACVSDARKEPHGMDPQRVPSFHEASYVPLDSQ